MKNKKVLISLSADNIHHGHIKLINEAKKYGDVVIGLLSDEAIAKHKKLPLLNYDQRKTVIQNISGVSEIITQNEWDDSVLIEKFKPEYVIHGDDWLSGPQVALRDNVLKALNKYNGKLIEIPYTKGISSEAISNHANTTVISPENRLKNLKRSISIKPISRFIEAHSPISALIAEKAKQEINGKVNYFDGFWSSSLTDSSLMGKPDIEVLDISQRLDNINKIFEVTTKPLIMDIDTGGKIEHLKLNIRSIERLGISAVIMEDKTGLKKNSLNEKTSNQKQDSINNFCNKIKVINSTKINNEFMVIARIESLILQKGMEDALKRAKKYIEAGTDGIMIHSKMKNTKEIFEFATKFRKKFNSIPLVCVPSTYNTVKENALIAKKFNIVIYANHLFRSAYPAMQKTAYEILKYGRTKESDKNLISIKDILKLIPGTD